MISQLHTWARIYAGHGFQVFPLKANKAPDTMHGFHDATSNLDQIDKWWNDKPDALIGCRIPQGQMILDIDIRYEGGKVFDALGGDEIESARHYSGRNDGGFHIWLRHPGGDLSTKGLDRYANEHGIAEKSGIDLLHHELRYTILPPSPHPETGKPYTWDDTPFFDPKTHVVADCPEHIVALLSEAPTRLEAVARSDFEGESMFDWFEHDQRWADVLPGWEIVAGDGEQDGSHWRHPDASNDKSATIHAGTKDRLYVWSDNTVFETGRGYSKFDTWKLLEHRDSYEDALRALVKMPGCPRPSDDVLELVGPSDAEVIAAEQSSKKAASQFKSPRQIIDMPPAEWLIEGLLEEPSLGMLYGTPGVGKSFFALGVGLHVCTGRTFFDREVRQGHVLYMVGEGVHGMGLRLQAWLTHHGLKIDDIEQHMTMFDGVQNLASTDLEVKEDHYVLEWLREHKPRLIVVDTVARYTTGANENSTEDMNKFISNLDLLKHASGGCVLAVHHSGKASAGAARGSTVLLGGVDTELRIKKDGTTGATLSVTKQKNAQAGPDTYWYLEQVEMTGDVVDGTGRTSAVMVERKEEPISLADTEDDLEVVYQMICQLDEQGVDVTREVLLDHLTAAGWKRSADTLRKDRLPRLIADGRIHEITTTEGGKRYGKR